MYSYFIRHDYGDVIDDETIDSLLDNNRIAIHFKDIASLDPKDYEKNARRALFVFRELEKNGGYIWAEYKQGRQIKVGKVVRGSFAVCETPNKDNLEKRIY